MNRRTFLTRLGLGAIFAKPIVAALAEPTRPPSGNFSLGAEVLTDPIPCRQPFVCKPEYVAVDINQIFLARKEEFDKQLYGSFARNNPWGDLFLK